MIISLCVCVRFFFIVSLEMFDLLLKSYVKDFREHAMNYVAFICAIAHGVTWPLFGIIFGELVNSVGSNTSSVREDTKKVALYMLLVGVGAIAASSLWNTLLSITAARRSNRLRQHIFETIVRNDMSWFDSNASQISSIVVERLSVTKYRAAVGTKLGFFVYNVSQGISGFSIGFVYGWQMPLVVIACTPLIAISTMLLNRSVIGSTQKAQSAYNEATSVCEESLFAVRTVRAFNGEQKQMSRFHTLLNTGVGMIRKASIKLSISYGLGNAAVFAVFAIAFLIGGLFIRDSIGDYNGGNVISVLVAVLTGSFGFGQTSIGLQAFGEAQSAMALVDQTLTSCRSDIESRTNMKSVSPSTFKSLDLHNVEFKYSKESRYVLRNVSMHIKAGTRVAIVGESGAGKSSLTGLLLRNYDPDNGSIKINNTLDYRDMPSVQSIRSLIGYVGQEPVLFSKSVKQNLLFGLDREVSDIELYEVLDAVNAKDFVNRLPNKLDTSCGVSAGLSQLSGGQKQRLAIARALLRNPKILILDEATSALDNESERSVIDAIKRVQQQYPDLTTVSIAHRLSTVRDSDCIFVIGKLDNNEDGSIVLEQGTHAELMTLNRVYAKLVGSQATASADNEKTEAETHITTSTSVAKDDNSPTTIRLDERAQGIKNNSRLSNMKRIAEIGYTKSDIWRVILGLLGCIGKGSALPIDALIFSSVAGYFFIQDKDEMIRDVAIASAKYLGLSVGVFFATMLAIGLFAFLTESVTNRIREKCFYKVLSSSSISFFDESKNSPSVLTACIVQSSAKAASLVTTLPRVTTEALSSLIAGCILSFTASPKLAAVLVATFPLILAASAVSAAAYMGVDPKDSDDDLSPEKKLTQIASETLMNIRTVRSLGGESVLVKEYTTVIHQINFETVWKAVKSGVAFGVSMGLVFWSNALGYWYGGILVGNGEIGVTDMTRAILGPMLTSLAIGEALVFLPDIGESIKALADVIDLLDSEKFNQQENEFHMLQSVPWTSIGFNQVRFRYPSRPDTLVLKNLSVRIPIDGKRVALVGPSGGGKSTLFSLLMRYYDPVSGSLVLNDSIDILQVDQRSYRSRIGYVSQEPVLFDTSLRDNVLFGVERDVSDKEELELLEELRVKAYLDFVGNDGQIEWSTKLGPRGSRLSGGQKQRVAIARAIARRPELLLMDEATSALDQVSEKFIQDSINVLLNTRECRAVVVVAHRLSTVVNSDLIVVVQDGDVVQTGTHQELIKQSDKTYAKLYAAGIH